MIFLQCVETFSQHNLGKNKTMRGMDPRVDNIYTVEARSLQVLFAVALVLVALLDLEVEISLVKLVSEEEESRALPFPQPRHGLDLLLLLLSSFFNHSSSSSSSIAIARPATAIKGSILGGISSDIKI